MKRIVTEKEPSTLLNTMHPTHPYGVISRVTMAIESTRRECLGVTKREDPERNQTGDLGSAKVPSAPRWLGPHFKEQPFRQPQV